MNISLIKELREITGAGIKDCQQALLEAGGDKEKAIEILRGKGWAKAEKKKGRTVKEGIIEAYIHPGSRIGVLVEINCETDFVARTDEFKQLAHDIALQVAATSPKFISPQEMPPENKEDPKEVCLLLQPFIKDPSKTIEERIKEAIAKLGENIVVRRFARFELGE